MHNGLNENDTPIYPSNSTHIPSTPHTSYPYPNVLSIPPPHFDPYIPTPPYHHYTYVYPYLPLSNPYIACQVIPIHRYPKPYISRYTPTSTIITHITPPLAPYPYPYDIWAIRMGHTYPFPAASLSIYSPLLHPVPTYIYIPKLHPMYISVYNPNHIPIPTYPHHRPQSDLDLQPITQ